MKAKYLKTLVMTLAVLLCLSSCGDDGIEGDPPHGAPYLGEMLSLLHANDMGEVTRFLKKEDWRLVSHTDSLYNYEKTLRGNRYAIRIAPMRSVEAILFAQADATSSEIRRSLAERTDYILGDDIAFTYSYDSLSFDGELRYGDQRPDALTEVFDTTNLRAFSEHFRKVCGYYSGLVPLWFRLHCTTHHAEGMLFTLDAANFRRPDDYTGGMEATVRYSLSYDLKN